MKKHSDDRVSVSVKFDDSDVVDVVDEESTSSF